MPLPKKSSFVFLTVGGRFQLQAATDNRNSSNVVLDSNDQWREFDGSGTSNGLEKKLEESELDPIDDWENALWPTLIQGAYTTILEGADNGTGIGLIDFLEY